MWQLMPQCLQGWVRTGGRWHSLPPSFNGNSMPSIWSGFNNLFWKDDKTFYNSNVRLLLRPPDFVPGGLTPSLFPFLSFSLSLSFFYFPPHQILITPLKDIPAHSVINCEIATFLNFNRHFQCICFSALMETYMQFYGDAEMSAVNMSMRNICPW